MKIPVVIRFIEIFNKWHICHAKSYQSAFRFGFITHDDAITYCEQNGTVEVVYHSYDKLQDINYPRQK